MYPLEATRLFYESYTILPLYKESQLRVITDTKNFNDPLVVTARRDAQKEMSRILLRYLEMMDSNEKYYVEQLVWTGEWISIQSQLSPLDILFVGYIDMFTGNLNVWKIQNGQYIPNAPWHTPCLPMAWRVTPSKDTINTIEVPDYYTPTDRHILHPIILL